MILLCHTLLSKPKDTPCDGPVQYEIYWWTIWRNTSMRKEEKNAVPASVELFNVRGALALKQNKEINTKESNMSCDLASTHAP